MASQASESIFIKCILHQIHLKTLVDIV
jgi:hypothetical protein